jgi:hypothetical protein
MRNPGAKRMQPPAAATRWRGLAPERRALRETLAELPRVAFLAFDADRFPVRDALYAVRRLRGLVEPLSRELAAATELP